MLYDLFYIYDNFNAEAQKLRMSNILSLVWIHLVKRDQKYYPDAAKVKGKSFSVLWTIFSD